MSSGPRTRRVLALALVFLALARPGLGFQEPLLEWSELPALPDPIGFAGPFGGVHDGVLLVGGGANFPGGRPWQGHPKVWHDRVFALERPDGPWAEAGSLPRPAAYGVSIDLGGVDGGVLCIGGGDADTHFVDVFLLRLVDGVVQVEPWPSLPEPCAFACGALVGDQVYVAGGRSAPDAPAALHTFWSLDLEAPDEWIRRDPWPGPARMLAVAGSDDQCFYLFSGVELIADEQGATTRRYLADAYRFHPRDGWSRRADLPRAVAAAPSPAALIGTSTLLVLGGDDGEQGGAALEDAHPGFPAGILGYDTITDTWSARGALPKDLGPDPAVDPEAGTWPPVTTVTTRWQDRIVVPSGEIRPGVRTSRVLTATVDPPVAGFGMVNSLVVTVYFALLVAMGVYFSRREKSTDDFFLGGRRIPWWAAGISIFGTQLSAITFMAVPALVYRGNWLYLPGTLLIVLVAPVVVRWYLPFFRRLEMASAYEFLERRFHRSVRVLGSVSFCLMQVGRMGVVTYLPALALSTVTGLDLFACILGMGVLATVYTVLGGIEAVIWTDVLQVFVLLGGALVSVVLILGATEGGVGAAVEAARSEGKLQLFEFGWSATHVVFWVVVVGRFFENLVPYTSDQAVIQRYLTTRDERAAARSVWMNAALTIPGATLFFAVGTALWVFYREHPERLNPAGRSDDIFPWFIAQELPAGVAGLVIAGLLAAAMSSLDSAMNSTATAITEDFHKRRRPGRTDSEYLRFARLMTVILGVVGTGSAVYMALLESTSMWDQWSRIVGLFGGGVAGLFLLGVFTRRASTAGALAGFVASAVVLAWVRTTPLHFFLYSAIAIGTCFGVGMLVSVVLPVSSRASSGTSRPS